MSRTIDGYPLTPEQNNVIDLFATGKSLTVTAYAGAGKTSTLLALARENPDKRGLYIVFGKDASDDAKKKFKGENVDVRTTHGLAHQWIRSNIPDARIGKGFYKPHELANKLNLRGMTEGLRRPLSALKIAAILSGWIINYCCSGDDELEMHHFPAGRIDDDVLNIDLDYILKQPSLSSQEKRDKKKQAIYGAKLEFFNGYLNEVKRLAADVVARPHLHPINHDIYMKIWSLSSPSLSGQYDYIMLDEAQDSNDALIHVLAQQSIQIVVVGDSHQQIFRFRGASDAMKKIKTEAKATLSTSFRYGVSLGRLASNYLNGAKRTAIAINGAAPGGTKINLSPAKIDYGHFDAVLCRGNKSIVKFALSVMEAGRKIPRVVLDRGGVESLIDRVKAIDDIINDKPTNHPDFLSFQGSENETAYQQFMSYCDGPEGGQDKTLVKLIAENGVRRLEDVLTFGKGKRKNVTIITTAHKSKGAEWDNVLLAGDYPSSADRDEVNLLYVAMTRAKKFLDISLCEHLHSSFSPVAPSTEKASSLRPSTPPKGSNIEKHRLECEARYWVERARVSAARAMTKDWGGHASKSEREEVFRLRHQTSIDGLLVRIEQKRGAAQPELRDEIKQQMRGVA